MNDYYKPCKNNFLNLDKLKYLVDTYYYSTELNVTVIDPQGEILYKIGEPCLFCEYYKTINTEHNCIKQHLESSKIAANLGEDYISNCNTGLVNFTVPIVVDKTFKGALICGPILMGYPDELLIDNLIKNHDLSITCRSKFNLYLNMIPIVDPQRVRYLSRLLLLLSENITTVVNNNNPSREKSHQQSKISEVIHEMKLKEFIEFYPYEKEKELIIRLKNGDIIGSKASLNKLLGHILFNTGGDIEIIKARVLELCALLSRAAVEAGGELDEIFGMNYKFMTQLSKINNIEDLCFWLSKILERFGNSVFNKYDIKNRDIIKQSINYMNDNYMNPINLESVAKYVHLNPTYFSTIFKKELSVGFSDYLNKIRIEQSKLLLSNSNYSILDIAIMVGFEDQSYFSKVFKKMVGVTPKDYKSNI